MKNILQLLLIFFVMILLGSCEKRVWDNPWDGYDPNTMHNHYFKATFDNYWAPGEQGRMLFLSDLSGNLLAEQILNGQNEVVLFPKEGTLFPDRIIETLVYEGPYNGSYRTVYFYSHYFVASSDWIYKSFLSNSIGNSTIQFLNRPGNSMYSISDYFEWIYGDVAHNSSDTLKPEYTLDLGRSPDNCYVLLKTSTGDYKYKWIPGITNGGNSQVDLSVMDAPLTKTMTIPDASYYACRLCGYLPAGEHSTGLYTLDYSYDQGGLFNTVLLHYPPSLFTDYELYLYYRNQSDPTKEWYQYNFVTIPDAISKINGDIRILDSTVTGFRVQVSGTFDRLGSTWNYTPPDNSSFRYEWHVYGPSSMTSFNFPGVPAYLSSLYQGFRTDSLRLSNVEIKDFDNIQSYEEYIQKVFGSGKYIANLVGQYSGLTCYPHPIRTDLKVTKENRNHWSTLTRRDF